MDLELNDDHEWYDRGYSLAKSEATRDAAIPILIGAWCLAGLMYADPVSALLGLCIYTAMKLLEYRDSKEAASEKRERYDPGDRYEWNDE